MKVFFGLISLLLTVILLFAGCASPIDDPTLPTETTHPTMTTTESTTQPIPSETEEDDDSVMIESLLGVENLHMQIVDVQDHPYNTNTKLYTYRFYSEESKDLLLLENVLEQVLEDFDGDGVVELFAHVFGENQYVYCDLAEGNIVKEFCDLVPDAVLDYEMLLDAEEYYLYEERWAWFLKDPETYVKEVAKRSEDRLYFITPSGMMPSETDPALIQSAYERLCAYLDGEVTTYEKRVVYKIMTTMEYSYTPEFISGQIDYVMLFEKWGFTSSESTEERNCYDQIVACFDADPMGFIRGMEERPEAPWPKDLVLVASRLAEVNCMYDREAYGQTLDRLGSAASTDAEKEAVQLLRWAYDEWKAPALDQQSLTNCSKEAFWRAFCYAPDQVLKTMENANIRKSVWGIRDYGGQKLLDKGYAAVNRALAGNPSQAMKDAAYPILLILEYYGGYEDTYVQGQWFHYQRLFEKSTYADGALATMCFSQMYDVFEANPEGFMKALAQGDWNIEIIALNFANQYQNDEEYAAKLNQLLEMDAIAECVQVFIAKLNNG